MKKRLTYVTSVLLLLIYSISLGVGIGEVFFNTEASSPLAENEHQYGSNTTNTQLHTVPYESVFFSEDNLPSPFNLEDTPFLAATQLRQKEHLLNAAYKQYAQSNINTLISHRKNDIIFPFHYFW
ncbi:hypothetical protein IA57_08560 [Mangrovimonas yunxiaonensis]|uniref:Uncharacterized protein n=1 Tax=Mangrovimonas yunxiaonensis TaxID=1197477 RepID=A0A084TII2_9FLAO|nr:hypothetical protein [Mangrovimonas yunxiaonensis]KFB00518.1 hypothetical protein IA57_08560 [Mangrovimonas yunxiaonensis]GGH47394.1 hypothetical protein GCM10011364_22210 [Mangrovimonas yunxiaonensis]